MNEAISEGAKLGLGYGPSLYRYLSAHPERFPYYDDCVFVQCQRYGVPYTCHISIGTDIIHQHPAVVFKDLGAASGRDFRQMCHSIAGMNDGGVFLNFGSAISGPEIFLKGLALARNRGLEMKGITAANFDIVPASADIRPENAKPEYHYRPRRVFIDRLSEIGGQGLMFRGLHQMTIPALFHKLLARKAELGAEFPPVPESAQNNVGASQAGTKQYPVGTRNSRLHAETLSGPARSGTMLQYGGAAGAEGVKSVPTETAASNTDNADGCAVQRQSHSPGAEGRAADVETGAALERARGASWHPEPFGDFVKRLEAAKTQGARVLVSLGSDVVGSGVNRYLIDLVRRGYISHIAITGAGCLHDVELAAFGQAEELEAGYLREGKLAMWAEPAQMIHQALAAGSSGQTGYGERLMHYIRTHQQLFPYLQESLLGACMESDIPYTCHITLGTDDIQVHPESDIALQAEASGYDFQTYCYSVAHLEGGVFMNFGSTVTGPEVFLKALSISRNLQYPVHHITTANFDIVRLGDYSQKVGYEDWDYYYRPRKNIVHRPTSLGGKGFHFEGLHQDTIPAIWQAVAGGKK